MDPNPVTIYEMLLIQPHSTGLHISILSSPIRATAFTQSALSELAAISNTHTIIYGKYSKSLILKVLIECVELSIVGTVMESCIHLPGWSSMCKYHSWDSVCLSVVSRQEQLAVQAENT